LIISKLNLVLSLLCLLASCDYSNPLLEQYSDFLYVHNILNYCMDDGVYNGKGRFYLEGNHSSDEKIKDDGQLCQALLSAEVEETKNGLRNNSIDDLTELVAYSVPSYCYSYVKVYEGDILGCELHTDSSPSYYRYFFLRDGEAQGLYELALDVKEAVGETSSAT